MCTVLVTIIFFCFISLPLESAIDVSFLMIVKTFDIRKRFLLGAFIVKGTSGSQVQVLSKDYGFLSLKHGLHVLDKAHYWMIVTTSKV